MCLVQVSVILLLLSFLGSSWVKGQQTDEMTYMTTLTGHLLGNYICNDANVVLGRKRRSVHPIFKRQTDELGMLELKKMFGDVEVEELKHTLMSFFYEDIMNHVTELKKFKDFKMAEMALLRTVAADHGVKMVDDVIAAIMHLRQTDLITHLINIAYSGSTPMSAMCELVYMLPMQNDTDWCAYWNIYNLFGDPCGDAQVVSG